MQLDSDMLNIDICSVVSLWKFFYFIFGFYTYHPNLGTQHPMLSYLLAVLTTALLALSAFGSFKFIPFTAGR